MIQSLIIELRGQRIILDSDLAMLYQVPTKALNQAVKRHRNRFPDDFMFQLNKEEYDFLKSQIVTSAVTDCDRKIRRGNSGRNSHVIPAKAGIQTLII